MNVDALTVHGLGFAGSRSLAKRKFDLTSCVSELLHQRVLALGPGQTDAKELFLKRGKGYDVVVFHEGDYFREAAPARTADRGKVNADDPLYEPLRQIGVDGPAIRRLFKDHSRSLIQRWVRITEAALHDRPRGFPGFRVAPAAFLIDGVRNNRTPPDWMHSYEKR